MIIWTVCMLAFVVVVKYYTSLEMRKLERRLETVKNGLHQMKEKLQAAEESQHDVQAEETGYETRLNVMREIIQDIQFRLTSADEVDVEGVMASDGVPPPPSTF